MAFTDGRGVMGLVEQLIRDLYKFLTSPVVQETNGFFKFQPLAEGLFPHMSYDEAMSKHGSDKPDLRIQSIVSS
jgi:aspartyl-tRNA synthetase